MRVVNWLWEVGLSSFRSCVALVGGCGGENRLGGSDRVDCMCSCGCLGGVSKPKTLKTKI